MHAFNTLAPIFLTIIAGVLLRRSRFITAEGMRVMNRLAYWIGLPSLLFLKIAQAGTITAGVVTILMILLAGTAVALLAGFALARLMRLPGKTVGSFVQVCFRGNLAYIGLAVIVYFFGGADSDEARHAEALGALALGPVVVAYNVTAVILLLASRHSLSRSALGKMARGIATNPLLIACVAGLGWSLLKGPFPNLAMPLAASRTLGLMGQFTLPLALLCVGGTLATTHIRGHLNRSLLATGVKIVLCPLAGLGLAMLLGATREQTAVAVILLASPTAIASYVLTEQLRGDTPLTASAIVISTLLSFATMAALLSWL